MQAASKKITVMPIDVEKSSPPPADDEAVRLTYGSMHDLVSPANQICSLTGLLIRQYGDRLGPDAGEMLDLIQGSVNRLQKLLAGFRTYAQIAGQKAPLQLCDGNDLLTASLSSLKPVIDENGASVTRDDLPELYCDPAQITFVFLSLMENSIKFRSQARPEIHVSAVSDEDMSTLVVRDNGIGIDSRNHRRIFEMFKRVHNERYSGAGVGLAIVERIVQRHGGQIWVDSELGQGATFSFSLPRPASLRPNAVVA
jgi:light-regulated signal transduction histidine kinase (bacteriophytochrome)